MQYKCPKCGNLVEEGVSPCPTCGQIFNWPTKEPEPELPATPVVQTAAPQGPVEQAFPTTQPVSSQPEPPIISNSEQKKSSKGSKLKKGCLGCSLAIIIPIFLLIFLSVILEGGSSSSSSSSSDTNSGTSSTTISATSKVKLSNKTIVGTWRGPRLDYTETYASGSIAPNAEECKYIDSMYKITAYEYPIKLYTEITFNSDGTYTWSFSRYDLESAAEAYANGIYQAYYTGLQKYDSLNGYSRDVEALLTSKGFTKDYFKQEFMSMFEEITPFQTGKWKLKNGCLETANNLGGTSESEVSFFDDSGNTLIIGTDSYTRIG